MCPEKRKERSKNQVYMCTIDGCDLEFIKKSDFCKHATFSHCLAVKNIITQPPTYKSINTFCLETTPITRASRSLYSLKHKSYFKELARHPCKQVADFKSIKVECKQFINFQIILYELNNNLILLLKATRILRL
jgi:hypothetical protein